MSIEKFLFFWSNHNAAIIETLIALILVSVIYLAFRTFWGPASADQDQPQGSASFSSAEIEKTLQKILETQKAQRVDMLETPPAGASADGTPAPGAEGGVAGTEAGSTATGAGAAGAANTAGAANAPGAASTSGAAGAAGAATGAADEKDKAIEDLKKQLQQAKAAAAAASTAAASAVAAPASSAADNSAAEQKIKDLEARLSEYEIISEDIADLSFYKEENARLQKELAALKTGGATSETTASVPPSEGGGGAQPAAESATPATEAQAAPAEPVATTPPPSDSATSASPVEPPAPAADATAAPAADATPPSAEAAPVAAPLEATPMDDDLMKEFAAAVETQKAGTPEPVDNNVKVEKNDKLADNQNLLGEFENFMKKG